MHDTLLLSRRVAAQSLSISLRLLDELIAGEKLRTVSIGRRRLISRRELEQFARAQEDIPTGELQQ